nr:MAG TPA: hypothetical protein [Caudoviricetes sp.]
MKVLIALSDLYGRWPMPQAGRWTTYSTRSIIRP